MFAKHKQRVPAGPASGLSFDELINKKRNLDLEIASRQDAEVEQLKDKVTTVCDALGITVVELFGIKSEGPVKRRKPAAKVKYRDPDYPDNTWTGKGKPPKWLQEKLDQGAAKDQFLLKQ